MDLRLYGRVLWRFKFLFALGTIVAVALALLSVARVSFAHGTPKFSYRHAVTYVSAETLLITQTGFPAGRSTFPYAVTKNGPVSSFADPSRFASLADFYAFLANSDSVAALARQKAGRLPGAYSASPVVSHVVSGAVEPLLQIQGLGTSPVAAVRYAAAGGEAFMQYLSSQQSNAGIPESQRVIVSVLNRAGGAAVLVPRKKTVPVVVFVAVLAATLALALVLENLRPRIKAVQGGAGELDDSLESRRLSA